MMVKWLGIRLQTQEIFKNEAARNKLIVLQAVRLGFFTAILLITVIFQVRQKDFVNVDVVLPLYTLLSAVYFLNSFYTYFIRTFTDRLYLITASLFAADTLFITGLIYYTEFNQSIFLFLYLINIILCGMVFQRLGAFVLALLTSICFSFLLVIGPPLEGAALYFTVGVNNLAFVSVALLSGYLSEQLNFMGSAIKAREADIRVLQNLNKMIVENIAAGLMTIQTDGKILHSNPSARKILDRKEDLTKYSIDEVIPDLLNHIQAISFEDSKVSDRFEIIYITPKTDRLLLGFSISPLREENDKISGFVLIFQDLTEIKRLERAMQRSEKLAAVGKLAAGIAHEIRNPLASISGSIQLLKSSLNTQSEEEAKLMSIVLKEIDRLNGLINEFLDFVRPEQTVEKVIDLESLIKEVLDMAKVNTRLRPGVLQELNFNSSRKVLGNPDKLKQVFLNLVINAYQAMEKSDNPKIVVSAELSRGLLQVKVQDNGIGMSESVVKRLFEPFFTTKATGTGLGLATIHKILESHEAKIFVESAEGKGTEFIIEFSKLAPQEDYGDNKNKANTQRGHG